MRHERAKPQHANISFVYRRRWFRWMYSPGRRWISTWLSDLPLPNPCVRNTAVWTAPSKLSRVFRKPLITSTVTAVRTRIPSSLRTVSSLPLWLLDSFVYSIPFTFLYLYAWVCVCAYVPPWSSFLIIYWFDGTKPAHVNCFITRCWLTWRWLDTLMSFVLPSISSAIKKLTGR